MSAVGQSRVYLVGFAEAVAAPEVFFSLFATGARIVSFFRSNGRSTFARLNFVEYYPVSAPEQDFNAAVRDLEALVRQVRPDNSVPCDDVALLLLSQIGSCDAHCLSPASACDFAMDKAAQIEAASASGLHVMRTKVVSSEDDVAQFGIWPAILKPRAALDLSVGRVGKGRTFILEKDRLPEAARTAIARTPYLIQEYKIGVGEGCFGIAHAGKVYASFGHRRLRMMNPAGSGASACVSREPEPDELRAVEALVKAARWEGPFMVEFLRDPASVSWFMEFNGRFWGSLALARACGIDMPRIAVELARGEEIVISPASKSGFARHLGRDLAHLMFVLRGVGAGPRPHGWPTRLRAIKDVISPHALSSFYNYHPSQPLFFVRDAAVTILNLISRKVA